MITIYDLEKTLREFLENADEREKEINLRYREMCLCLGDALFHIENMKR